MFRQLTYLFLMTLLSWNSVHAQEDKVDQYLEVAWRNPDRIGLGARIGAVRFDGDVRDNINFHGVDLPLREAADMFVQYQFIQYRSAIRLGIDFTASYRVLKGIHTSYEFSNKSLPLSASLEAEIFPLEAFKPFFSVGFGVIPYSLSIQRDELQNKFQELTGRENGVGYWFPVRFGTHIEIAKGVNLQLVLERSVTLTDRLDGVVSKALDWLNDNFNSVLVGVAFHFEDEVLGGDADGDGLTDREEAIYGTNPLRRDTDGDGLGDGTEVRKYRTNPLNPDSDSDGLSDGDEVQTYRTDPLNPDTDSDESNDGAEIKMKTDPLNPDTDGDGVIDGRDQCPHSPETYNNFKDSDGCPDEVEKAEEFFDRLQQLLVLENIEFEIDKAIIRSESFPTLDKIVAGLKENPNVYFEIAGHTDSTGTVAHNMDLSKRRADAVMQYLVEQGIPSDHIKTRGYGPHQPAMSNETEEGRARNRRIEFRILKVVLK